MKMHRTPSYVEHCLESSPRIDSHQRVFYSACENGQYNLIEKLISSGEDVNGTDDERPLIAAAGNGHRQCVQLLLRHGAEVNISNSRGRTSLLAASQSLFMYVVESLLDAGAKPSMDACHQIHEALRHHGGIDQLPLSCIKKLVNALSLTGIPLVELSKVAFERARLDLVRYLLDKESDSTVREHYSFALHYAAEYDWIDVVRHLLDRGVEINSWWNSETALCCACRCGHSNIVLLLLQRGAYSDEEYRPSIQTVRMKSNETIESLLPKPCSSYSESSSTIDRDFSKSHPLHIAYYNGQWDIVKLLLNLGFSVDSVDKDGVTILHKAIKAGLIENVKILIDLGANVRFVGPSRESVLHMVLTSNVNQLPSQSHNVASNGETIAMIRLLVAGGADCNAINALGETPLYRVCAAGLEDIVKFLLEAGSSVDTKTTNRFPLVAACASGNSRVVEQLLKAGALVNVKAIHPAPGHATLTTPLCVAAMYGHREIVGLLLQRGAFADVRDELGETVLSYTLQCAAKNRNDIEISSNYSQILKLLISHVADVNSCNYWGETALHKACSMGLDSAVELLLERNADLYAISSQYETPLMVACKNNRNRTVELIFARGDAEKLLAKVETPYGTTESTPLHEAVRNGNEHLISVLLSHGAAVNETNDQQETALHLATSENIVECLLKHRADVNAVTVKGETPLYVACQRGRLNLIDILIQYSADPNGQSGKIPLFVACQSNNGSLARMLLWKGADPNIKLSDSTVRATEYIDRHENANDESDETPLHGKRARMISSDTTKSEQITSYDTSNKVMSSSDATGHNTSLLHLTCEKGDLALTTLLLLYGASVSTVDSRGRTPLHCAADHLAKMCGKKQPSGNFTVTNRIVHVGNSVAARTGSLYRTQANPWPYLNWSVELFGTGCEKFRKTFSKAANGVVQSSENRRSFGSSNERNAERGAAFGSLNYSATVNIVDMLIKRGADVNVRDVAGKTILCRAVEIVCTDEFASSHSRMMELLLQNGADVDAVSADNTFPTYSPCVIENTLLIAHGAQPSAYRAKLQRVVYHRRLDCADPGGNNISSEDQAKEIVLSADQVSLYQSPLCIATENENARVVDILLRFNADVNFRDATGRAAPRFNADVNLRDATGRAALHYACENNDSELVKQLLMAGADRNLPTRTDVQLPFDVMYRLPLCIAAEHGNRKVVELLLQSQANVCQQDGTGRTALHCAVKVAGRCRRHFRPSFLFGAASGESCDSLATIYDDNGDDMYGGMKTMRQHSDSFVLKGRNSSRFDDIGRHADVVVRLLDYGADVNAVDVKGQTALYMAVKYGLADFVKLMLDGRRADPNRTTSGRYPLNVACAKGNTTLIEILLEAKANPNLMTPESNCLDDSVAGLPLCIAAARGDLETMKLLLKHRADAKLTDWNGNSVLSCLFDCDEMDIDEDTVSVANLLLENGADPNCSNTANEGPVRMLLCKLAEPYASAALRSFVHHGLRLDDSEQNVGEYSKNSVFRLKKCIASSEFLREIMFELFKAGAGRKFMAAGCESDRNMRDWRDDDEFDDDDAEENLKDIRLCLAIVLDGFRVSDDDLRSFQETDLDDDEDAESSSKKMFCDFRLWLTEDRKQAPSLMRQCRTAIRRQLLLRTEYRSILSFLNVLPLPNQLISYLKYEGPISEVDLSRL